MSPQKARSELMKFDSGPDVGTLRSENDRAVKFGVIAQSWTNGILGGDALNGAATNPIASAESTSNGRSFMSYYLPFSREAACGRPPLPA
jgi:hypothetical protein